MGLVLWLRIRVLLVGDWIGYRFIQIKVSKSEYSAVVPSDYTRSAS